MKQTLEGVITAMVQMLLKAGMIRERMKKLNEILRKQGEPAEKKKDRTLKNAKKVLEEDLLPRLERYEQQMKIIGSWSKLSRAVRTFVFLSHTLCITNWKSKIKAELQDELLKGEDPKTVLSSDGSFGELKKALAERILNATALLSLLHLFAAQPRELALRASLVRYRERC